MPFPSPFAVNAIVDPLTETAPVVLPAVNVAPAPEESVVSPDEARVVNAAVDGVEAPRAVALIPVAVVLKLPEVMTKLFAPVEILEALKPERVRAPEVAVK